MKTTVLLLSVPVTLWQLSTALTVLQVVVATEADAQEPSSSTTSGIPSPALNPTWPWW